VRINHAGDDLGVVAEVVPFKDINVVLVFVSGNPWALRPRVSV
jgi:hypothetical protein